MRAVLDDTRIPMMELLVAARRRRERSGAGITPSSGACETLAPKTLKWLLDHGG